MSQVIEKTQKNSIKKVIASQGEPKGKEKTARIKQLLTKRLYDLKEAAYYLGRPIFSVRGLIWKGALPYVKEGRRQYLDVYDMDKYIECNKETMI